MKLTKPCRPIILRKSRSLLLAFFLLNCLTQPAAGQAVDAPPAPAAAVDEDQGLTGFGLALRKLGQTGSVLYLTAHPDDEHNAVVAWLGRGQGFRGAYLTLTRGDGGQNEIGPELFEALGVLRTEELAAIHRLDGFGQYYSRAFEFGYSFSVEETLEKWGKEEILEDIVRVIRHFRPTIVITLSPEGTGGGQHHQASARLALEAFHLSGDATRFPNQVRAGLRPWRPLRLFQAASVGMGGRGDAGLSRIRLDAFDPLLGETYAEFGARARGKHRSQGMNILPEPGPMTASFRLAEGDPDGSERGLLDGLEVGLGLLNEYDPAIRQEALVLQGLIERSRKSFEVSDISGALESVVQGLKQLRKMSAAATHPEVRFLLKQEEEDFVKACEKGLFISADAQATGSRDGKVVPGEEFTTRVRFHVRSEVAVEVTAVELLAPKGWTVRVGESSASARSFVVKVSDEAGYSGPYWRRPAKDVSRFVTQPGFSGVEENAPPPLTARIDYKLFGESVSLERPVEFRRFDPATGLDSWSELRVVPVLSSKISPRLSVVRQDDPQPRLFEVRVTNAWPGIREAKVRLEVPGGWRVEPPEADLHFSFENEERSLRFQVSPSAQPALGAFQVSAVAVTGQRDLSLTVREVAYPHIRTRQLVEPAEASIQVMKVKVSPGLRVGYVMGVGDEVGEATRQLGAEVTYLDEEALSYGDLDQYDVIVTGVRAYWARRDLIAANQRLLEYVQRGGYLVVQYNKYEYLENQYAPFPLRIRSPHDRVTVEESPVRVLAPEHPVFNTPNRMGAADWDGWVQERGLYFLGEWDERYQPLLELTDPWPYNSDPKRGSLVVARYGSGTFVYTGLAFFRQLPEGVEGAFRLWANLLGLGRELKPGRANPAP